jgi:hypothetical protein
MGEKKKRVKKKVEKKEKDINYLQKNFTIVIQ